LWAERRRRATPKGSRALTCFWQAVLVLRWFRDRTDPTALGRDHDISRATAYRYIDEVIEVLAGQAVDLHEALQRAKNNGLSHLITDGTIIESDRCAETTMSLKDEAIDLWYSGKAHTHGGNVLRRFTGDDGGVIFDFSAHAMPRGSMSIRPLCPMRMSPGEALM
jgi:hypothetical protein